MQELNAVSSKGNPRKFNKITWDKVRSYDLTTVTSRLLQDHPELIERIANIEIEYRRFIYLCAVDPSSSFPITSDEVDLLWHCHIIHTKMYREFCNQIANRFIDHVPYNQEISLKEKARNKKNLLTASILHFGDIATQCQSCFDKEFSSYGSCGACSNCSGSCGGVVSA